MIDLRRYSFGAHVGVLTSLGLIVGLDTAPGAKSAVIESLLIAGIAGNLETAMGIYVYRISEHVGERHALADAVGNFAAWLFIAFSFIAILVVSRMASAVSLAILWGLCLLAYLGFAVARARRTNPSGEIAKHIGVGLFGLAISEAIGVIVPSLLP